MIAFAEGVGFTFSAGANQGRGMIDVSIDRIIDSSGINLGPGSGYCIWEQAIPTTSKDGPSQAYAGAVGRLYLPFGELTIDSREATIAYDTLDADQILTDPAEIALRPELINNFLMGGMSGGRFYEARTRPGTEINSAGRTRAKIVFGVTSATSLRAYRHLRDRLDEILRAG